MNSTIAELRETHRMHQALLRACTRLVLQIKAIERRVSGKAMRYTPSIEELPADSHQIQATIVIPTPKVQVSSESGFDSRARETSRPKKPQHALSHGHDPDNHLRATKSEASAISSLSRAGDSDIRLCAAVEHASTFIVVPHEGDPFLDGIANLATLPLQEALAGIRRHELKLRRRLEKLAKTLPAYSFVEGIKGFGAFGLAQIVAEAGDLASYAAPAKLWKRMGLAVIAGMAQRRVTGAEALEHGFSPARRSIMFMIGDSLIKQQNVYRNLYLKRKEFEAAKQPDFSKMRLHLRAHRYAEKRLLRDLWRAWRNAAGIVPASTNGIEADAA